MFVLGERIDCSMVTAVILKLKLSFMSTNCCLFEKKDSKVQIKSLVTGALGK